MYQQQLMFKQETVDIDSSYHLKKAVWKWLLLGQTVRVLHIEQA